MNLKTYSWIKYLATLGSILLFTAPLLGFLQQWKNIFSNFNSLLITLIILTTFGILIIIAYILLRLYLTKKSPYQYNKKDKLKLKFSISAYLLGIVITIFYIVIALVWYVDHRFEVMIIFIPCYLLLFASMIIGAIFESLSRVNEQVFLHQLQTKKIKQVIAKKRSEIVDEDNIDYDEIAKEVNINRTTDAQKLLSKNLDKIKKQSLTNKKIQEKKIHQENNSSEPYNPFMDQKLNEELKNDQFFQDWLINKDKQKED